MILNTGFKNSYFYHVSSEQDEKGLYDIFQVEFDELLRTAPTRAENF